MHINKIGLKFNKIYGVHESQERMIKTEIPPKKASQSKTKKNTIYLNEIYIFVCYIKRIHNNKQFCNLMVFFTSTLTLSFG